MEIKNYIKVFNRVPKDACEQVIEMFKDDPKWEQHTWFNPKYNITTPYHNKELEVLYPNYKGLDTYINDAISDYHESVEAEAFLITKYSNVKLNRYKTGTLISEHRDLIRRHKDDGVPVLSIVGLLNDDYEGGEFVMNNEVVPLKQGDILIFPSTFFYSHRVNEITAGTRNSFVSWAY
jgi:predicted 2-oxoglutarate/Fe(II)-dependent dioxygenase YbiX